VSRSSAEVEYRSMTMTTYELKWLKEILSSLNMIYTTSILLHYDSQVVRHISKSIFSWSNQAHWSILSFCLWCLCSRGYSSQICFH